VLRMDWHARYPDRRPRRVHLIRPIEIDTFLDGSAFRSQKWRQVRRHALDSGADDESFPHPVFFGGPRSDLNCSANPAAIVRTEWWRHTRAFVFQSLHEEPGLGSIGCLCVSVAVQRLSMAVLRAVLALALVAAPFAAAQASSAASSFPDISSGLYSIPEQSQQRCRLRFL